MKFRLLNGKHRVAGGLIYRAGDVLESDQDLSQVFRNKFARVTEDQVVVAPVSREALINPPAPKGKKGKKVLKESLGDEPEEEDAPPVDEEEDEGDADSDGEGASTDEDDDLIAGASTAPKLSIKAIRGTKMFNVVNEDGEVQNAKPLSRAKAMQMAYPEG